MDQPPAGAQYSPDGAYWWDDAEQQWKLVALTGEPATGAASTSTDPTASSLADAAGSSAAVDTSGLVTTLEAITSMDEEALARSSSGQIDEWIAVLNQWHDHLAGGQGVA
jgi:hypothetical protein